MANKFYKEESRSNWGTTDEKLSIEQINLGANLRIADALEIIAKDKGDLEYWNKRYKERSEYLQKELDKAIRSANAYKGKFNSLKNKGKL